MSHFTVLVFTKENGKDVDELLAPYDENMTVDPYIKYTKAEAIAKMREDIEYYKNERYAEYLADPKKYEEEYGHNQTHINYIKNEFPKRLKWTDEECYEQMRSYYEDEDIDEEGNIYSTYNPNSKWDWYVVGGRWEDGLTNIEGKHVSYGSVKAIDWNKTNIPFAFVTPDGKWHERGKMGWWAIVSNEKGEDVWEKEFRDTLESLKDDNVSVVLVDCHI